MGHAGVKESLQGVASQRQNLAAIHLSDTPVIILQGFV